MATGQNGFVARLVTAVNDHDLEALVGLFATDYVNQTPVHPARSFTGQEQVRRNWETIFAAVPDLSASVTAQAVVGDAVWTEWEMEGTRRDGLEHHLCGVVIFTVVNAHATAGRFYLEPLDIGDGDVNAAVDALVKPGQAEGRP